MVKTSSNVKTQEVKVVRGEEILISNRDEKIIALILDQIFKVLYL